MKMVIGTYCYHCSVTKLCLTLSNPMDCSMPVLCPLLSPTICSDLCPSHLLLLVLSCLVQLSNHLIFFCLFLLLPSIFPSIKIFSNESTLPNRWPNYWNFSFSVNPFNEYPGLISFRIDWFDLAVQGTLNSLLQHHNSKASILQYSAFFMVHVSHLYITTGKTIALTGWTFVSKVMFLLLNMLSRFVMAFLPRSKCLLISCFTRHLK